MMLYFFDYCSFTAAGCFHGIFAKQNRDGYEKPSTNPSEINVSTCICERIPYTSHECTTPLSWCTLNNIERFAIIFKLAGVNGKSVLSMYQEVKDSIKRLYTE